MTSPNFSIIIPGFNRPEPLKHTLRSAAAAAERLAGSAEIILVDDGSEPALTHQLAGFDHAVNVQHVRQPNQGSIVARLTGLRAASGAQVLFLDSDDLIHPDKLKRHAEVFASGGADIMYDDMAEARLGPDFSATFTPGPSLATVTDQSALFLTVQPAPHGPTYRRTYLTSALAAPLVPLTRWMDPAGDIWLYYNLLVHPARIAKINASLTATGPHEDVRYSQHWEILGAASLLIVEEFTARCPDRRELVAVRRLVGETAFRSWRRLPRDYHAGYANRLLAVWRAFPHGSAAALGGPLFRALAALSGAEAAGQILRCLNHDYASCRTMTDAELARLFPPPDKPTV